MQIATIPFHADDMFSNTETLPSTAQKHHCSGNYIPHIWRAFTLIVLESFAKVILLLSKARNDFTKISSMLLSQAVTIIRFEETTMLLVSLPCKMQLRSSQKGTWFSPILLDYHAVPFASYLFPTIATDMASFKTAGIPFHVVWASAFSFDFIQRLQRHPGHNVGIARNTQRDCRPWLHVILERFANSLFLLYVLILKKHIGSSHFQPRQQRSWLQTPYQLEERQCMHHNHNNGHERPNWIEKSKSSGTNHLCSHHDTSGSRPESFAARSQAQDFEPSQMWHIVEISNWYI